MRTIQPAGVQLLDWNTSNELVYLLGSSLSFVSPANLTSRRAGFSYGFQPRQILQDNLTVAGMLRADVHGGAVVESHLALVDLAGRPVRQLSFGSETVMDFAVSPDRSMVIFTGYRTDQRNIQLRLNPSDSRAA